MRQRTDTVALVAGATVGMGGGALGEFLVCMAGRVVVHRILDPFDDQYRDFRPPAPRTARHGGQSASLGDASVTHLHRDRCPRTVPIA